MLQDAYDEYGAFAYSGLWVPYNALELMGVALEASHQASFEADVLAGDPLVLGLSVRELEFTGYMPDAAVRAFTDGPQMIDTRG